MSQVQRQDGEGTTIAIVILIIAIAATIYALAGCNTFSGIVTGVQRDFQSMTQSAAEWQADR
jgi:predicted small secreted protein